MVEINKKTLCALYQIRRISVIKNCLGFLVIEIIIKNYSKILKTRQNVIIYLLW
jgi:hypothetical protein